MVSLEYVAGSYILVGWHLL